MRGIGRSTALLTTAVLVLGGAVVAGAPASASPSAPALFDPPSVEITALARYNYQRLLRVSWRAGDRSGTQIDRVEIWAQTVNSQDGWKNPGVEHTIFTYAEPGSMSLTTPAIPGTIQCFRAVAYDAIGGTTSTARTCTETPDDAPFPMWPWRSVHDARYLGQTLVTTWTKGHRIRLDPSHGITRFGVLAVTCPTCGRIEVWGGGRKVGTISLVNTVTVRRLLILPRTDPRYWSVVFKVVSSGKRVSIDALLLSTY